MLLFLCLDLLPVVEIWDNEGFQATVARLNQFLDLASPTHSSASCPTDAITESLLFITVRSSANAFWAALLLLTVACSAPAPEACVPCKIASELEDFDDSVTFYLARPLHAGSSIGVTRVGE
eukprot:CAMPEP_0177723224 /NCGR_PEP_ID=MMETSP0484_2-20121128/18101_1 /TAXON_ID=354590 /ORGANISM="Rhodomonas lens, Strain RHODO" /LENGTH=121 /DNA_ID=CAMNT_0019235651 /DNA_START=46 /DNA_END=409 /DNA_ORIENTATION=+